ncbi:hypothetical protein CYLTODRAFT_262599 [Cylindrobasidium torrendii FP15055 ss-10]|uniref:Uncharacterized protein n=1 Tax=Cylindrobasidium torrendii FP15055 ss-10 TaxID=1314674 RepID=A0A0D7BDS2_9AGAR|nr:hypothetical protein CYLTODRAFT_262599 [Cylindrobasidium torrendii FP15055 ss-10]
MGCRKHENEAGTSSALDSHHGCNFVVVACRPSAGRLESGSRGRKTPNSVIVCVLLTGHSAAYRLSCTACSGLSFSVKPGFQKAAARVAFQRLCALHRWDPVPLPGRRES